MHNKRNVLIILGATVLLACTCPALALGTPVPSAAPPSATSVATASGSPAASPAPGVTPSASATLPASATPCTPTVTANINANVRTGPGTIYDPPIGNLLAGQTAAVAGQNSAGTWWYINFAGGPGGYGWIAASTVTAACLPSSVAIIAPPPLPPTLTPEPIVFAVTHVGFTLSTTTQGSYHNCPLMIAHIKTNAPGNVKYHWTRSDGASAPVQTLHFASAGTQDVEEAWFLGSVWSGTTNWLGIYIDDPNAGDFGHKTFTTACTSP